MTIEEIKKRGNTSIEIYSYDSREAVISILALGIAMFGAKCIYNPRRNNV